MQRHHDFLGVQILDELKAKEIKHLSLYEKKADEGHYDIIIGSKISDPSLIYNPYIYRIPTYAKFATRNLTTNIICQGI